ncbi:MAG: ABC transporter ATP-binding protein [Abditibacteriales bacterium]|nr:ABC transporter ATP-binding protein [Abditibacteriales bacterium]
MKDYPMGHQVVHALRGVTLEIQQGDYIAIMGPSGCGKSTLLNILGCVEPPTSGKLFYEGRAVNGLSDAELTRLRLQAMGFVFQRFFLLPMLTAEENVMLPMMEAGVPKAERVARARALLDYVGLSHRARHKPSELSGGEMQRVAIARALANRPQLLLADEPTGELDAATGAQIAQLFRRLNDEGMTIVMVTHNAELAQTARRLLHMRDGQIVDG